MTIHVMIHEIVHAKLHTDSHARFGDSTYQKQEFEAESIAYILSNHLGSDTSSYSFGYLSSWTKQGKTMDELDDSLNVITTQAKQLIAQLDNALNNVQSKIKNPFEERITQAKKQDQPVIQEVPLTQQTSKLNCPIVSQ